MTCREPEKELAVYEWTLGKLTGISAEDFWTSENTDTTGYDGNYYLARDKLVNFERELWLELRKCMGRKH